MHTLCCGKATPRSHAHCRPGALCAARLRKHRASGLPGGGCFAIATLPLMASRAVALQIAVAMRCPAQGDRRNAKARRARPRCDALGSARRHAQMSPGAIAELGMCHVQRVRCGLRHASGSLPPMRILRHAECAGVCERCSALQASIGGFHRFSVAGHGRWHAKKTVAAAQAATTVSGPPAWATWSRGVRTCSESTSAACRCRPCPAAR
ncbi:hypothetical protein FHY11_002560 [Xanthomonas arboricola]|nr:hypothetical protein [Xanthomonas euroxanthea]